MGAGARLTPIAMVAGLLALAVSAATAAVSIAGWSAAVALAILGGIIPVIQGVNVRVMPVFARRSWRSERWLHVQVALSIAGGWVCWVGLLLSSSGLVLGGSLLALAGGLVFTVNIARLMRQPAGQRVLPIDDANQQAADRIGIAFSRLSVVYLLIGLGIGVLVAAGIRFPGRPDLLWAHAMLLGFVLSMVSGVSYHVLGRWTGRAWRDLRPIALHLRLVQAGLPLMLLALALGNGPMFTITGIVQALALLLFLVNIAPMVTGLPAPTKQGFLGAAATLGIGVVLGGLFALDPALGAKLRQGHATLNLFGFAGLLISGSAYYLAPRFAGKPLRWPRLAALQVAALMAATLLAATGWGWMVGWGGSRWLMQAGMYGIAACLAAAALVIAGTFRGHTLGASVTLTPPVRQVPMNVR
jgi:hypothetical protein